MDKQSCITDQLWLGYSNKSLGLAETDLILNHIATCEVCADIKEGIDAMHEPEKLEDIAIAINKRVDEYLEPKHNLGVFWYWSAAAVLIMGIGLSWFWINDNSTIVKTTKDSLNIVSQPVVKEDLNKDSTFDYKAPVARQIPLALNEKPDVKPSIVSSKDDVKKEPDNESVQSISKTLEAITSPDTTKLVETSEGDTIPRGIVFAFENKKYSDGAYSAPPVSEILEKESSETEIVTVQQESKKRDKASYKSKSPAMPAPMNNSNVWNTNSNNNYSWTSYSNTQDSIALALAQNNFNLKNFSKCMDNLAPITGNPSSLYYEDGLLLKAKALIKQSKTREAKAILKKVISLNSVRKLEADGILKGLK